MKKGSVIVDLAAENGGNCALTEPGSVVERHGVHIIGYIDLPSRLAPTASVLYGNNLAYLLDDLGGAANFHIDLRRRSRAQRAGRARRRRWSGRHRRRRPSPRRRRPPRPRRRWRPSRRRAHGGSGPTAGAGCSPRARCSALGLVAPPAFLSHLTVFVLACIVGWQVVWNVTPALHTPLMSVTNAISGIIVVGGMLTVSGPSTSAPVILGAIAILLASINIAGGFLVTQRMLRMFRR